MAAQPSPQEQLFNVLVACRSADPAVRNPAEAQLKQFEAANLTLYLGSLCTELNNEKRDPGIRQLAGLQLKNAIYVEDEEKREVLYKRWLAVAEQARRAIKQMALATLGSPVPEARRTTAQVIAALSAAEIPQGQWPEVIPALVGNIKNSQNPEIRWSSFTTLGYICTECPKHLEKQSTEILNAILSGLRKEENNVNVKLAATTALRNSLKFCKANFEKPAERALIMNMIFSSIQQDNEGVRVTAYECLVEVAEEYYQHVGHFMNDIFRFTSNAIKNEAEAVQLQAIEFWSSICDVEIEIKSEQERLKEQGLPLQRQCFNFMGTAVPNILPLLVVHLTKQSEEVDDEQWNTAMAAGTCLALAAQAVGDPVVGAILPFIQQNISNKQSWRHREAAILAFGSIIDGPSRDKLAGLVKQAFNSVIVHMKDDMPLIKDTTAWTLGRICATVPEAVAEFLPTLMDVFELGLNDKSTKVASNVAWAIHNLADNVVHNGKTSPLSRYFERLVRALLTATERPNASENNLLGAGYEAINILISRAAADSYPAIATLIPLLLKRLQASLGKQTLTAEEKEAQMEAQGLLCGSLQIIINKLDASVVLQHAGSMMQMFLAVLNVKNASVLEDALQAVAALAVCMGKNFIEFLPQFKQFLLAGLRSFQEPHLLTVSVGVVGDISRALEEKLPLPFCDEVMNQLLKNLQNRDLGRSVKPHIIGALSDIALAVGGEFTRYLKWTMQFLAEAGQTQLPLDPDNIEFLNVLNEAICECYTGIITSLASERKANALAPFAQQIFGYLESLSKRQHRSPSLIKSAISLIGDLASQIGAPIAQPLQSPFIKTLIQVGATMKDEEVAQAANATVQSIQKALQQAQRPQ